MGIQVLPEGQGGFGASFGNALGQGISQQLPEEIKRYRLKSGLENLGKQNINDPYQLLSQLATIPGLDPNLLGILAPALQGQIGRQQAGAGFGQQPQQSFNGQVNESAPPALKQGQEPKISPQGINPPEIEPINQLATNLLRSQPFNYPNIQAATAEADKRIGTVESEFDKQTKAFLQKGKELQEGEIGGDVLDLMRQKAIQDLVTTGKSERSIAQKYANQAKEIAKEYGAIKKVDSDTGIWNRAEEKTIKGIRDRTEKLSKLGIPQDQILDHLQTDLNLSRAGASYLLNPLNDTKAGRVLHKLHDNTGFTGIKSTFSSPEIKLAKEIAPLVTEEDLIGSLAYIVERKGYDWKKFVGALQADLNPDKITTPQSRDLANQSLVPKIRPLSELYLLGFSGESKKAGKRS